MVTWNEINEKLDKVDLNNDEEDFDATLCNEIAHDAIAKKERDSIMTLIRHAAESGCFRAILPHCHPDTTKWLKDLGFEISYQGQTEVSWEDYI